MTMSYNYVTSLSADPAEMGCEPRTFATLRDRPFPKLTSSNLRMKDAERTIRYPTT